MQTSDNKSARRWRLRAFLAVTGALRIAMWMCQIVALCGVGINSPAATLPTSEIEVKAAFLLNFPKYVEWPVEIFAESNSPIRVTILGDAILAENFEKISAGKTVNGRPLLLQRLSTAAGFTNDCEILFIGTALRTSELLPRLHGPGVLTVSDDENFLDQGGAIRFVRRNQKIRLEINLTAANEAGLKISSKLLSVADVVKGTQK